jgi:hypothetical protein
MLAGVAIGFALGTKLTMGLTVPILLVLAIVVGRRALAWGFLGGVAGFVAIGMWGYVMNRHNTGHLLGVGTSGVQNRASPEYPESLRNGFLLVYGLMDGSILSSRFMHILALVGIAVGIGTGAWALRRYGRRRALRDGTMNALPFLAPVLVIGGAGLVAWIADKWGLPLRGDDGFLKPTEEILNMEYGRIANENYSAYGPVGIVAFLAAIGLTLWDVGRRRAGGRQLVLALALPVFLVLVALTTYWVPFLIRYFTLPAVIATPLLARLFASRLTTLCFLVAAAIAIGMTITHDQPKPLNNPYGFGRPWNLTQENALRTNSAYYVADALRPLQLIVPPRACIGSVLGVNEAAYLLYGRHHRHKVFYLPPDDALNEALRKGLWYVVLSKSYYTSLPGDFEAAGWKIRPLGSYWVLASHPGGGDATC